MNQNRSETKKPMKRIVVIALCLLAMIPAALAYAGGGLLSGFPSSATVGDSVTWKVDPGDEEGELKVSASGASVSVSGNSFTVKFNQAGTVTIKASIGGTSDSCSVSVSEPESSDTGDDDADNDGDSGDDGDDPGDNTDPTDENDGDDSGDDNDGDNGGENGGDMKKPDDKNGAGANGKFGKMPSGGMSGMSKSGGFAAASGAGSSSAESKTTYTGSADNYLDKLSVKGHKFTQSFHKTNNTYFLTLSSGEDSVTVNAEASDSDADVIITGADELTTGRNKIMVSVTAENGDVRVYRIYADVK